MLSIYELFGENASEKVEEIERAATPEPSAQASGGLSSLLGGWWGRR